MTVPINQVAMPSGTQVTTLTIEFWFKADDIGTIQLQVILGLTPYKVMKKAGLAQVILSYGGSDFCPTSNLLSNTWYHFAFTMSETNGGTLNCYLLGQPLNTGTVAVSTIASNVQLPKEISFGTSTTLKPGEATFNGYIKEFRWWQNPRNQF